MARADPAVNVRESSGIHPMRTIERAMNDAITASKDWRMANTRVENSDGVAYVFLHNNLIAKVGETWLELFDGGYRSATTKSRLNAILRCHGNGEGIYQKSYQWFISTGNGDQPFVSGIRLD